MRTYDVLIIGSGHAGSQAAIALRDAKFDGRIAIVSDEADLPYERPPLSKDYLSRESSFEDIMTRPAAFWADRKIDFQLGCGVSAVDAVGKKVTTAAGEALGYGSLIWAAGGRPRRLGRPGDDLAGVHAIRTRASVDRLIAELDGVSRVVIIGGGYIGLEAAAVLTKLGKSVTLLEVLPRVLARVSGEPLSRFIEAQHRVRGVDIRLSTSVSCIEGSDGHVQGVRLADGEVLACELVIVGVGIQPAVEPLLQAGAEGGNGVDVDEYCRTTLPNVYAIGDCAGHLNKFAGGARIRLESVQNANDQALVAAKAISGSPEPYSAVPWFWSDQYDLRIQTAGLWTDHDKIVVRDDVDRRSFSIIYLNQDRVIALDCINAPRDFAQGRALVAGMTKPRPEALADPTVPLRTLISP